jgi:uncharacterized protein YdaU (DUF1376 family)
MANKPPAFQFYVKDWLSSSTVRSMSLAARGAYIDLLAFAWQSQPFATLPNDPAQLCRLVGADSTEWPDIWPQISGCFEVEDGRLVNRRLQDEASKREEFIKKQQANGARGGRPSKNPGLLRGFSQSEPNDEARESSAVSSIQSSTDTGTATGKHEDSTGGEQEDNRKPIQSTNTDAVLVGDWAEQLKMDDTEQRKFQAVMNWKETKSWWKGKPLFSLKAYRTVEAQYDKFYAKLPAGKKPHDLPVASNGGDPGRESLEDSVATDFFLCAKCDSIIPDIRVDLTRNVPVHIKCGGICQLCDTDEPAPDKCVCEDPMPDANGDCPEMYGVSCRRCGKFVKYPEDSTPSKAFEIED